MNKQIKQIAEQAKKHSLDAMIKITDKEQALKVYSESYDTKFAKLIIGECMRMCDVAAIGYESHGHMKEANGCYSAKEYIEEHFGVEE